MAENGSQQFTFQLVTVRQPIMGGALRDESGCTVRPTGSTRLNVSGTDLLNTLAHQKGLQVERYHVFFGANPEGNLIAVYPCDESDPNAMPLRRYHESRVVAFHLGGVFRQFSMLRPPSTVQCLAQVVKDIRGEECLAISLGSAMTRRAFRRSASALPANAADAQATAMITPDHAESDFEEDDPW